MRACLHCRKILPAAATACPEDASLSVEVVLDAPPTELASRLRNLTAFACGGTGQLFAADTDDGESVLLKVYSSSAVKALAERTRCKRELQKQAGIAHVNLPRVITHGESDGRLWMVRELVAGESLAARLRRQGALPVPEALAIAAQVASALDELHRQGLVHRDVKPGHILLTERTEGISLARLIDTGMAERLPGDTPLVSHGTPAYAAPEIGQGKPASFRSDLYALGCVLYEMLAGAPPFAAETATEVMRMHRELEPARLDVELPAAVNAVLDAMLAKEPRKRPLSARQARRSLEPHLPAHMPPLPVTVRSALPPPSAAGSIQPQSSVTRSAQPLAPSVQPRRPAAQQNRADDTEELSLTELEPAAPSPAPAPAPSKFGKTQELDLTDIESLPPLAPNTQELELSEIEPLPPANPRTQELEISDLETLDGRRLRFSSAPAPRAGVDTSLPLKIASTVSAVDAHAAADNGPLEENARPAASVNEPRSEAAIAAAAAIEQPLMAAGAQDSAAVHAGSGADQVAAFAVPTNASDHAPSSEPDHDPDLGDVERADATRSGARPSLPDDDDLTREYQPDADFEPASLRTYRPPRKRPWPLLAAAAALLLVAIGLKFARSGTSEPEAATSSTEPSGADSEPAAVEDDKPAAAELTANAKVSNTEDPPPSAASPQTHADESNTAAALPAAKTAPPPADETPNPSTPAAAPTDSVSKAEVPAAQTIAAAEAGKAYLREGSTPAKGGVVPYKPRVKTEVDYKNRGLQLFQAGRYREAADAYERATQKAPSDPRAFAGLGASWLSSGEPDRAILAYQRAVQLKPEVSGFQAALGRAYLTKGDRARAIAAYSKALALDPKNQAAKSALASLRGSSK